MAASKRILSETGFDPDQNPREKRLRPSLSFRSVIVEVMRVRCFHQSLCGALEPLVRKVVSEEVEHAIRRKIVALSRSTSLRIKGPIEQPEPSHLKLVFSKKIFQPIFTGSKIHDCDQNPLRIMLVSNQNGQIFQESLPYPIKIELVAIDGDFCTDRGCWSTKEFESGIIKERTGRRPLLAGELVYTMRDGYVVIKDIEFTDNSSWIRGRKFRIGARVVVEASSDVRVLQAVSEPLNIRDHRGELYKKHYPPVLSDEVWRLEKIGKDGIFHKKLGQEGIKTVQDFLKLSNVNPTVLRTILGPGMSDRIWEITMKHARTCDMDNKYYVLRGENHVLALNPTCQVLWANINGISYTPPQDCTISTKARIEELVKFAYDNWFSLEEVVEGPTASPTPQLMGPPQIMGPSYNWVDNETQMVLQSQYMGQMAQLKSGPPLDGPFELGPEFITTNVEMGRAYYSGNNPSFENLPNSN
ncbi:hypothetical protein V2J09_020398 [Rumex salicifolius]